RSAFQKQFLVNVTLPRYSFREVFLSPEMVSRKHFSFQKQCPESLPRPRNSFQKMFLSPETGSGIHFSLQKQFPGSVPLSRNSFRGAFLFQGSLPLPRTETMCGNADNN